MRLPAVAVATVLLSWATPANESAVTLLEEGGARVELPAGLSEVSGLVLQGTDTLWAHDDERAVVFALDAVSGRLIAVREMGPQSVRGDFEGIAWDGRRLHLVTSTGTLLSFEPGTERVVEEFRVRETAARSWCEVEGLAFDPERNTLVMACKTVLMDDVDAGLLLLEVDLPPGPTATVGAPLPVRVAVSISRDDLRGAGLPARPALSDLEYDASRRSWLTIAARQGRVIEVARDGTVLAHARLRSGAHPQAEGLALAADRRALLIADEGGNGPGRLHRYGPRGDVTPP